MSAVFSNHAYASSYSSADVLGFKRIGHVVASEDGKQAVYTVWQVKQTPSGQQWQALLYLKDDKENTLLITINDNISSLSWSPDNLKIAYLVKTNKTQSLWLADLHDHKIKKIVELDRDIEGFKWSPDGKHIAFTASDEKPKLSKALMLIDVSKDYVNTRIYIISATETNPTVRPITSADMSITGFFDPGFDWSPDSQSLAFAYQPRAGASYMNKSKIGMLDLKTHDFVSLPFFEKNTGVQPTYSHDGKWIAFRTNREATLSATELNNDIQLLGRICVFDVIARETHCLENTVNESPVILGWDKSDNEIFVLDAYQSIGYQIYAINVNPKIHTKSVSNVEGFIEPLTITLNNSGTVFGFGYETSYKAPEAFTSSVEPFNLKQITNLQSTQKLSFGRTETIRWKSKDGMKIEGLLITPSDYDKKKKYPVFVALHGGPAGAWAKRFVGGCDEYGQRIEPTSCWGNLQSLGFVIFAPNPRGSTGYGSSFLLANHADFGGGDYNDIMTGVDHLISKGIADPNRLAIGGWSFGGYMTSWAISQTDQFRAAVAGGGNTDFISFSGTSDIPDYYVKYLGNTFLNDDSLYLKRSPIMFVKDITTPLLILSGQNDVRVPISQSYELYTALSKQNKRVKMLVLPEQGHVPTDANIISGSIDAVDDWLKQAL